MTGVIIKRGKRDGHTEKEDDVNTHQKMAIGLECGISKPKRPRIVHKHQTLQETRQDSSLKLSERTCPTDTLISDF